MGLKLGCHFSHCWKVYFIPSSAHWESSNVCHFYLFCLSSGHFLNGSYCSFKDGDCGWKPISGRGPSWRRSQTPLKGTKQSCSSSGSRKTSFFYEFCNKRAECSAFLNPETINQDLTMDPLKWWCSFFKFYCFFCFCFSLMTIDVLTPAVCERGKNSLNSPVHQKTDK